MVLSKSLLISGSFLLSIIGYSQTNFTEECKTDYVHERQMINNLSYASNYSKNIEKIKSKVELNKINRTSDTVWTIPVVVHVIHFGESVGVGTNISDEQIQSAIDNLSRAFRNETPYTGVDVEIQFKLAEIDENCNATTAINRVNGATTSDYSINGITNDAGSTDNEASIKALSAWSTSEYYNIWVVAGIDGNMGGTGVQGYAYFPGGSGNLDGAVILYSAFGYDPLGAEGYTLNSFSAHNITAVYETGHWFNLQHTFKGDSDGASCPTNADCLLDGDLICDTPPHIRSSSDCDSTGTNSCDGSSLNSLFVHNFMDYSSDECQTEFTQGQKDWMRASVETMRGQLITSIAIDTAMTVFVPPTFNNAQNTSATGLGGGFGGIMNVTFDRLNNSTSNSKGDGGYMDFADECLKVVTVEKGQSIDLDVTTWYNSHSVKAWIDYNDDGSFDASEEVLDGTTADATTGTENTSSYMQAVIISNTSTVNTYLRMRVSADLNPIPDAYSELQYGQAEDYVIYVHEEVSGGTGISKSFTASFKMYPNPVTNLLNIQLSKSTIGALEVKNQIGQTVAVYKVDGLNNLSVNTSQLAEGIYIITLTENSNTYTRKFVVVR